MPTMRPHVEPTGTVIGTGESQDAAWSITLAAAARADLAAETDQLVAFTIGEDAQLRALPAGHPEALIAWRPGAGWEALLPSHDPRHGLIDLYLPFCSGSAVKPVTI